MAVGGRLAPLKAGRPPNAPSAAAVRWHLPFERRYLEARGWVLHSTASRASSLWLQTAIRAAFPSRKRPDTRDRAESSRAPRLAGRAGAKSPQRAGRLSRLRLVAIVSFLDEERHLPTLLDSIAAQTRVPDRLVLVDDGSRDASAELAERFVGSHDFATLLKRPSRPTAADRLADAAELRSFAWALGELEEPWDVVGKLDADLRLAPTTLASVEDAFHGDARLGVAGPRLLTLDDVGRDVSHRTRPEHVEGAAKFYRRACLDEIGPIPSILGWDTIDEVRARMRGWRTSGALAASDPVLHLRPMGARDGSLRAFRRWGACAYGYGEHPLYALLMGMRQAPRSPAVLGGMSYVAGWAGAAARRAPRAEPELRAYVRRAQLRRLLRRPGD